MDRTNRASSLQTEISVKVVQDTDIEAVDIDLIEEDLPSPGPSVPNGKFGILILNGFLHLPTIVQTNPCVLKYVTNHIEKNIYFFDKL